MTTYTFEQVEPAINYWRQCHASGEDAALCANEPIQIDIYSFDPSHRYAGWWRGQTVLVRLCATRSIEPMLTLRTAVRISFGMLWLSACCSSVRRSPRLAKCFVIVARNQRAFMRRWMSARSGSWLWPGQEV